MAEGIEFCHKLIPKQIYCYRKNIINKKEVCFMSMPNFDVGGVTCMQSVANLLQSVALEEAGLAHIINAEGQKIEKCIEKACGCNELIKINESVSDTLKNVIKLQMLLQFKLEEVAKIQCPPKHHKDKDGCEREE